VAPPTFSLFVNSTRSAAAHYLKYLEHQLRAAFEFQGTPIRLSLKPKRR
jgi:GTP-binding protein